LKKENKPKNSYPKSKGYPPYDDDKYYDLNQVVSANDCTGLTPTPPASESEAESYADLMNAAIPTDQTNYCAERKRNKNDKKK
jgi:hypothetical protein